METLGVLKEMNEIVKKVLSDCLDTEGKVFIPSHVKRVKIDVGLAFNAPNSELWLRAEDDLCVYGFEPNPYNVYCLKNGFNPVGDMHGELVQIDPKRINDTFFIVESAVSSGGPHYADFYCTKNDPGTSSMFEPTYFEVDTITKVSAISLKDFFDLFPWDRIPFIEQLKTDTQSSDFDVILGCGDYLREKVVYLDVETSTYGQYKSQENSDEFHQYIISCGFEPISIGGNSSYYNKKFEEQLNKINYQFQNQ